MPNSYFMLGILVLNIISWVLGTAFFLYVGTKKGWRGVIEYVGWAGYVAFFFGSSLGGAAAILNRPFHIGELLTVVLVESVVFAMSTVCTFIPDWFPASNEVGSEEQKEA